VAAGRIERDPTARLKMPREEKLSPGWLDRGEQWRLVREAERSLQAADTPTRRRLALRDWLEVRGHSEKVFGVSVDAVQRRLVVAVAGGVCRGSRRRRAKRAGRGGLSRWLTGRTYRTGVRR
jgi:hypothetical protein